MIRTLTDLAFLALALTGWVLAVIYGVLLTYEVRRQRQRRRWERWKDELP